MITACYKYTAIFELIMLLPRKKLAGVWAMTYLAFA